MKFFVDTADLAEMMDLWSAFDIADGYAVLRYVARFLQWEHGIAASADGDIKRRPRPPRIGEACGESNVFDEALCLNDTRHAARPLAPPMLVAVVFDLGGDLWLWHRLSQL